MFKDAVSAVGLYTVHIIPSNPGVSIYDALGSERRAWMKENGYKIPPSKIVKGNLVVNSGRQKLAFLLGKRKSGTGVPIEDSYIDRLFLGDCKVGGVVDKSNNLPDLKDTGLVNEISNLSGVKQGKISIDPNTEIFYPSSAGRYPSVGEGWAPTQANITIDGDGVTTLEDPGASFITTQGVQRTDQVTVESAVTGNVTMGVKTIESETELTLHNPNGFAGLSLDYRIDSPGTQVLFSKFIDGNTFLQADWGFATIIHEAGLLFNDGTLFNRVVFRPDDDNIGIVLQSDESTGTALSARFEILVTF